jgi:hypothetical protein
MNLMTKKSLVVLPLSQVNHQAMNRYSFQETLKTQNKLN